MFSSWLMKKLGNRSAASACCFWICLAALLVTCKGKIFTTLEDSEKGTTTASFDYSVCDFRYTVCFSCVAELEISVLGLVFGRYFYISLKYYNWKIRDIMTVLGETLIHYHHVVLSLTDKLCMSSFGGIPIANASTQLSRKYLVQWIVLIIIHKLQM